MAYKSLFQTRPHRITQLLEELRICNLQKAKVSTLRNRLMKVIKDFLCSPKYINAQSVYRIRKNKNARLFENVSELWYPNPDIVIRRGRANDKQSSIFYCADSEETAIVEMKLSVGDILTVLKSDLIDSKQLPLVTPLGIYQYTAQHNPNLGGESLEKELKKLNIFPNPSDLKKNLRIDEFLAEQFTKYVESGKEYEYKITIALSELFLNTEEIDGICYPSIAGDSKGINIAFTRKAIDRLYRASECWVYEVSDKVGKYEYHVSPLYTAKSIDENGSISWT